MANAEQENVQLRADVSNLKAELEKMALMMEVLMTEREHAAVSEPAPTVVASAALNGTSQPIPAVVTSAGPTQPLMVGFSSDDMNNQNFRPPGPHGVASQYYMPPGYPWGMPQMINDGVRPGATEMPFPYGQQSPPFVQPGQPIPQATMTQAGPIVHATQQEEEQVYHSGSVMGDDRVGNLEEKFDAVQKELRSIKGKEVFGQSVHDLCLVPNVVIPPKFKTPVFEKYTGETCPQMHLTTYVRKMTAHRDNEPLLIYCFEDSLAGPAHTWYMNLKSITTFGELADAFLQQYKYNSYLAPNRKELQSMTQGEKESFKEYAQRFIQKSAQIRPALNERELSDLFYETLSPFYSEKMVACASQKFTDMVDTGVRIEEWARKGHVAKDNGSSNGSSGGSSSGSSNGKKFGNGYPRKNTQEVGMVAHGGSQPVYPNYPYVANIAPQTPAPQNPPQQQQRPQAPPPYYPPLYQQPYQPYNPQPFYPYPYYPPPPSPPQQQQRPQAQQQPRPPRNQFPPIPMPYKDLLPSLLARNLVQTRPQPRMQNPLPAWYRADRTCEFHQGAPGHDIEHCRALKEEVQKLINDKELTFANPDPVVPNNPLPPHGPAVNMIQGDNYVLYASDIKTPLVPIHVKMCEATLFSHNHEACVVCSVDSRGCKQVQDDVQGLLDRKELVVTRKEKDKNVCVVTPVFKTREPLVIMVNRAKPASTPLVICPPEQLPYSSQKAVPYNYEYSILEDGKKVPLDSSVHVDNIAENSKILRSGRVFPVVNQKEVSAPAEEPVKGRNLDKGKAIRQPNEIVYEDSDEILKLIKRSEYKVVDQLLQTPAKISIMSLLSSSDAHRDALMKVLDQAYVEYDVTLGQFESIVGNVTACNNLSFSDEDLPAEGKNHNLALLISVLCKSDSLSNVLIDTGSALNVMPKSTLDQLSYPKALLQPSTVTVRAFDGTRRSVFGEIKLPISVGPHEFEVKFQVMEIQASFSCLLGRPWIHDAGAVTSTLHQKLKFISHGKLITVSGETALLVSNLSAFSYIGGSSSEGSSFQGLSVEGSAKKAETSMASLKDAQRVIQEGKTEAWGQLVELHENKRKEGIGFPNSKPGAFNPTGCTFYSAGFIYDPPETNAIIEDQSEEVAPIFVTPGGVCCNWIAVDVPSVIPRFK
jgi:hypothetical protein